MSTTAIVISVISVAFTGLMFLVTLYKTLIGTAMKVIWKYDQLVIPLMEDMSKSNDSTNNIDRACNAMGYIIQLYAPIDYLIASKSVVNKYLSIYLDKTKITLQPYVNSLGSYSEFTDLVKAYKVVMKKLLGDVNHGK